MLIFKSFLKVAEYGVQKSTSKMVSYDENDYDDLNEEMYEVEIDEIVEENADPEDKM